MQPYTAFFVFVFMASTLHSSFFKGFLILIAFIVLISVDDSDCHKSSYLDEAENDGNYIIIKIKLNV